MKTIRFENLIDTNTGKTVEIEVPDDFDENNPSFAAAGKRGAEFGDRSNKVVKHQRKEELKAKLHSLREVHSLEEVGQLGSDSAKRLLEMFESHGFGK